MLSAMTRSSTPLRRSLSSTPRRPTEVVHYDFVEMSIGTIAVAVGDGRIVGILIAQHPDYDGLIRSLQRHLRATTLTQATAKLKPWLRKVAVFVERSEPRVDLSPDIRGTPLQRRVWDAVLVIPFGQATTFSQIATTIGSPRAMRVVGNARSLNPLEFAIPCHRVVRSNGTFPGGSVWGDLRQSSVVQRESAAAKRERKKRSSAPRKVSRNGGTRRLNAQRHAEPRP